MIVLILLLSCAPARPDAARFDASAALAPVRARMDVDGDGVVGPAEYARVAYLAPPFETVDLDHDGDLGPSEIGALVMAADPRAFRMPESPEGRVPQAAPDGFGAPPDGRGAAPVPPTLVLEPPRDGAATRKAEKARRAAAIAAALPRATAVSPADTAQPLLAPVPPARWVLLAIREEIAAASQAIPLPSVERCEAVGDAGTLETDAARALLAELDAAAVQAGLGTISWVATPGP